MTNIHNLSTLCVMVICLLASSNGCNHSTDTQNQELDVSQITVTGPEGPADFLGNIDLSDWDSSSYSTVRFGKSFWVQKIAASDTLYFGGRSAGDTISQSLKIYNRSSATLSLRLQLESPFFATDDSIEIQPSALVMTSISFVLPDTTTAIYDGILTLRGSAQDSVILRLYGYHEVDTSGGPVVEHLPSYYRLAPAYPNPTDNVIQFQFTVATRSDILLQLVNNKNEVIDTISQGNFGPGAYAKIWHATVANGNYRVIFHAGNYVSHGDIRVWR